MQTVLDIDLDYFVLPMRTGGPAYPRYEGENVEVLPAEDACFLLEKKFKLTAERSIPGASFDEHKETFFHLERLVAAGKLEVPFRMVHLDAHHDLDGLPTANSVLSCNYMFHCIRNDWLDHIDFLVHPSEEWAIDMNIIRVAPDAIAIGNHRVSATFANLANFSMKAPADFVFLARSPGYTPAAADSLFEELEKYIDRTLTL